MEGNFTTRFAVWLALERLFQSIPEMFVTQVVFWHLLSVFSHCAICVFTPTGRMQLDIMQNVRKINSTNVHVASIKISSTAQGGITFNTI